MRDLPLARIKVGDRREISKDIAGADRWLRRATLCFQAAGGAMRECGKQDLSKLTGGVEYYQPAADIYNANHSVPVTVANILDIDRLPDNIDLLWASPVCKSFSRANRKRGETDLDTKIASHVARLMVGARPRHIAIENVRDYIGSDSFNILWAALAGAGYNLDDRIYNCADYGVPTTRERLVIRASLEPLGKVVRTHRDPIANRIDANQLTLFPVERLPDWIGWYEAIADRLEDLPESRLTQKQKMAICERFNNSLPIYLPSKMLVDTTRSRPGQGSTVLAPEAPAFTITAEAGKRLVTRSRILVERVGYFGTPKIYADCPMPTIRAAPHIDDRGSYRVVYNIIDEKYRVFAADIRCLAAWSGFPPDYKWGDNRGEAGRSIGNSVPPNLAKAIALSFAS